VCELTETKSPSPLTRPTSLEMLKRGQEMHPPDDGLYPLGITKRSDGFRIDTLRVENFTPQVRKDAKKIPVAYMAKGDFKLERRTIQVQPYHLQYTAGW
jgi:hypothetical protein